MKGEFDITIDGVVYRYTNYNDIPMVFDNLIRFEPEVIPGPHTEEEHKIMASYNDKLKELMKRETR